MIIENFQLCYVAVELWKACDIISVYLEYTTICCFRNCLFMLHVDIKRNSSKSGRAVSGNQYDIISLERTLTKKFKQAIESWKEVSIRNFCVFYQTIAVCDQIKAQQNK